MWIFSGPRTTTTNRLRANDLLFSHPHPPAHHVAVTRHANRHWMKRISWWLTMTAVIMDIQYQLLRLLASKHHQEQSNQHPLLPPTKANNDLLLQLHYLKKKQLHPSQDADTTAMELYYVMMTTMISKHTRSKKGNHGRLNYFKANHHEDAASRLIVLGKLCSCQWMKRWIICWTMGLHAI